MNASCARQLESGNRTAASSCGWIIAAVALTCAVTAGEARGQTENAFGMTWTVTEPPHRGVGPGVGVVTGMPNSLTLQGVWGADTNAIAPLSVAPGVIVKYDYAVTSDAPNRSGEGPSNWVGDAFGVFSNSGTDPSNANLLTTRNGIIQNFGTPRHDVIYYSDISTGTEHSHSLGGADLATGVHVEWLFSANSVDVSVHTLGGMLLGSFTDDLSHLAGGLSDIHGFRFNAWDTEETLTITNFMVVPEPAAVVLIAVSLIAGVMFRGRRRLVTWSDAEGAK